MENSTDEYVATVADHWINELHDKIKKLKMERNLEARYMTFEELLRSREKAGIEQGKAEAVLLLLREHGPVPEQLAKEVLSQGNVEILEKWLKLAAKVSSIEEFAEKMYIHLS